MAMLGLGVPAGLFNVLWWLQVHEPGFCRDVDYIEFFSGVASVHSAMTEASPGCQ